jgi:hypothetical protein
VLTSAAPTPAAPAPSSLLSTADASGIYRVGGDVTEPVELSRVHPRIPEHCRHVRKIPPVYIFEAAISDAGKVQQLRLLRGHSDGEPYSCIERAFREAIVQWRYRPATRHGKPVPVWLTITATVAVR